MRVGHSLLRKGQPAGNRRSGVSVALLAQWHPVSRARAAPLPDKALLSSGPESQVRNEGRYGISVRC